MAIKHVLFGPDGSRRYADQEGISFAESYTRLAHKLVDVVAWSFEESLVDELSLWILQEYNLMRSGREAEDLTDHVLNSLKYLSDCDTVQRQQLKINIAGELDTFYSMRDGLREDINRILQNTTNYDGKRVNVLVAYNSDKELQRAIKTCHRDDVDITFGNLSDRWSISPVTLFLRTGQPDGFVNLSSYWPLIERGRLISTPKYPQELSKDDYLGVLRSYTNLKDSVKKVRAAQTTLQRNCRS